MAQIPSLTQWHTYLQQRCTLCFSTLSLEKQVLLGPVEYINPPNSPASIPEAALWPVQREWGKFPLMHHIQMGLVRATCPHGLQLLFSPAIWMEIGTPPSRVGQWAKFRAVWLVITHKPWHLTLCTDSSNGIDPLDNGKLMGRAWISPCGVRIYGKTLGFTCKILRLSSLS